MQFAKIYALRTPQRRLLSSSRAYQRPPAIAEAEKDGDGVQDSASTWRSQPSGRLFNGGWAKTRAAPASDLTPEERALRHTLQNESRKEPLNRGDGFQQTGAGISKHKSPQPPIHYTPKARIDELRRPYSRPLFRKHLSGSNENTEVTQAPPGMTQRSGRLSAHAPGEVSQAASTVDMEEKTRGPRALRSHLVTPTPQKSIPYKVHLPQTAHAPGEASQAASTVDMEEKTRGPRALRSHAVTPTPPKSIPDKALLPQTPKFHGWAKGHTTELTLEEQALRQNLQKKGATEPHRPVNQASKTQHTPAMPVHGLRPGLQATKNARSEETARSSHLEILDIRRQDPQESTSRRAFPDNRHVRDAKNEHHVTQSRSKPVLQPGEQTEYARNWKHVRHVGSHDLSEHSQPEQSLAQRHSADTQATAKVRAIEQEKMERMERTKGGEFVGLRGEEESAQSKAMKVSHWSSGSEESQFDKVESTPRTPKTSAIDTDSMTLRSLIQPDETTKTKPSEEYSGSERGKRKTYEPQQRERQEQHAGRHSTYQERTSYTARGSRDRMRKSKQEIKRYEDIEEDNEDQAARRWERKEQRKRAKATQKAMAPPTPIYLPEFISVSNLASVLKVRLENFIRKMNDLGFEEVNNDHVLDAEIAGLVAAEFNFEPIVQQIEDQDLFPRPPAQDKSVLPPRPPVVTIMGHVDHGKTTLLDYLRKSSVAASEHGGITQHIGAFSVPMPGGRLVTFLDTPGHEAFLSMRQRGANVTDIVILVVAADDSVKPQTVEAIRHAQAAKVPMIVAVNKIDKESSNVERVKQDLARYSVEIEDFGGDTQVVCVSGKTGQGMEELEDATVALADILDMRSETDGQAEGWVLEATTQRAGRIATVLVKRGTLRPGDIVVAGTSWARVRSLRNEAGVVLESAGPGTPVEVDGWREQPVAGDEVLQAPDEQRAKAVVDYRLESYERTQLATDMTAVNEARRLEQEKREEVEQSAKDDLDASAERPNTPSAPSFQQVFFIVKADVSGSAEAVTDAVSSLGNSEVRPQILRTGVGPVNESDIDHAAVAQGHIISFNTKVDGSIQRIAESQGVKILDQSIIYRLVDDVKATLSEKLPDIVTQKVLGEAEIAQVFDINVKGRIRKPFAGCRVRNGVIGRNEKIRVLRGKEVIYTGMLPPSPLMPIQCR